MFSILNRTSRPFDSEVEYIRKDAKQPGYFAIPIGTAEDSLEVTFSHWVTDGQTQGEAIAGLVGPIKNSHGELDVFYGWNAFAYSYEHYNCSGFRLGTIISAVCSYLGNQSSPYVLAKDTKIDLSYLPDHTIYTEIFHKGDWSSSGGPALVSYCNDCIKLVDPPVVGSACTDAYSPITSSYPYLEIPNAPLFVFAINQMAGNPIYPYHTTFQLYGIKVTSEDSLTPGDIHNYIPVRTMDRVSHQPVGALYDTADPHGGPYGNGMYEVIPYGSNILPGPDA